MRTSAIIIDLELGPPDIIHHPFAAWSAEQKECGAAAPPTKCRGTAALKRKINPAQVPIEQKESYRWLENMRQSTELLGDPARCVHIGDRESGIYELFCTAQELGTHFLVRTCVNRLAGDGDHTIADEMRETRLKGVHRVRVRDGKGRTETALVKLRYRRIRVLPPIGKQKRYPALPLTVIHAILCAPTSPVLRRQARQCPARKASPHLAVLGTRCICGRHKRRSAPVPVQCSLLALLAKQRFAR